MIFFSDKKSYGAFSRAENSGKRFLSGCFWVRFLSAVMLSVSPLALVWPQQAVVAGPGIQLPKPAPAPLLKKVLTLQEAVLLALRQNPDVLNTELDMITDRFSLEIAQNKFLPQFTLGGGIATNSFAHYNSNISAATTIQTPLGGSLGVNYSDTLTGSHSTTFSIDQPLLKGFGLSLQSIELQSARDGLITNHLGYRDSIAQVIDQVEQGYRSLVKAQVDLRNRSQTVLSNKRNFAIANIKYNAGRISYNDFLQSKQAYISGKYAQTQAKQSDFVQYQDFLRLIGLDPNSKLQVISKLSAPKVSIPDYQHAVKIALRNNTAYVTAKMNLRSARRRIISAHDARKWSLDFSNTTTMNSGFSGSSNDTENTSSLKLKVPIRDISARQGLVSAKINLEKSMRALAQAKLILQKTLTSDLQTIRYDKQAVAQADQALSLQSRVFKGVKLQWQYGRISTIDLLQQQETLTEDENNQVDSYVTYLNDITKLYNYLGLTLPRWNVKLRYN